MRVYWKGNARSNWGKEWETLRPGRAGDSLVVRSLNVDVGVLVLLFSALELFFLAVHDRLAAGVNEGEARHDGLLAEIL